MQIVLVLSSKKDWKQQLQDRQWKFVHYAPIARVAAPRSVLIAAGGLIVGRVGVRRCGIQRGGRTAFGSKVYPPKHILYVVDLKPTSARSEATPWQPVFAGRSFKLLPGTRHYLVGGDIVNGGASETVARRQDDRADRMLPVSAWTEASVLAWERAPVDRFVASSPCRGAEVVVEQALPGGRRADLWVPKTATLIEAKWPFEEGGVPQTHVAVRMAVGQLLEYRHIANASLGRIRSLAVLLPAEPDTDVLAFLASVRMGVIWEIRDGGFTESLGGRWLSGALAAPSAWSGRSPTRRCGCLGVFEERGGTAPAADAVDGSNLWNGGRSVPGVGKANDEFLDPGEEARELVGYLIQTLEC